MGFLSFLNSPAGGTAMQVGGSILGGILGNKANDKSAKKMAKAINRATALEREAMLKAEQRYEQQKLEAEPGLNRMRQNIATPGRLTPDQEAEMDEARRIATNQLAGGGLRGSGRAVTASLRDVEGDLRRGFLRENRGVADDSARQLVTPYFGATGNMAQIDIQGGRSAADGAVQTGLAQAESNLASGKLWGETIGNITSAIAAQGRESRYKTQLDDLQRRIGQT